MWMRLSKFSLCNRLTLGALAELFAVNHNDAFCEGVDLRRADRWNESALDEILGIDEGVVREGFCTAVRGGGFAMASSQLRHCPDCLLVGFHAAWFQWPFIEYCPIHKRRLVSGCPRCGIAIAFLLDRSIAQFPLSCERCGCQWVPSLARPAGRCAPLANRPARAVGRWTTYVAHAVGAPPASPRRGRAAHPRSGANLRHLAIMSQLFDRPPPLPSQLMARRKRRIPRSEQPTPSSGLMIGPREVGYDASKWPHFGEDFARYEMLLSHCSPLRAPYGRCRLPAARPSSCSIGNSCCPVRRFAASLPLRWVGTSVGSARFARWRRQGS